MDTENETPQVVNLTETAVENVQAELVRMHQSGAQSLQAEEVDLHQSGIVQAETESLRLNASGVVLAEADEINMADSGIVAARSDSLAADNGQFGVMLTEEAVLRESTVGLLAGRSVQVQGGQVSVLIAGSVEGDVQPLMSTRDVALAGLLGGLAFGLVSLAGRFFFDRH